jgi:beta-glucosidase
MTANTDYSVPYNASNPDDIEAVDISIAFSFGWFVDPVIFGKYPDEMTKNILDGRLPTFTDE